MHISTLDSIEMKGFIHLPLSRRGSPSSTLPTLSVGSFPPSPVHYCGGNGDLAISRSLPFDARGLGRKVHATPEFLSPLRCREGNPTRNSSRAGGTASPSAGLCPSLRDVVCFNDSFLLCPLKFGRPCLSEILQALALSPCLYLAQTY